MNAPASKTSLREQRRLQAQDLSRGQLLDAAEVIFGQRGFHDATIKAIAELAEFSVGSVYSFFENKDDLFHQIWVRRGDEFMEGMRAIAEAGSPASDTLHALIDFQVGFFRQHPYFAQIVLCHGATGDEIAVRNYTEAMELQSAIFERGQRAGELRSGDTEVLSALFSGMIAAYQLNDPAVVHPEEGGAERLPLADLHDMVAAAFRTAASR